MSLLSWKVGGGEGEGEREREREREREARKERRAAQKRAVEDYMLGWTLGAKTQCNREERRRRVITGRTSTLRYTPKKNLPYLPIESILRVHHVP